MASAAVAGAFDPGHDRDPQFLAGGPGVPVENIVLQQREELSIAALSPAAPTRPIDPVKLWRTSAWTNFLDRNWAEPRSLWWINSPSRTSSWPDYPVLRDIRELRLACFAAQTATDDPASNSRPPRVSARRPRSLAGLDHSLLTRLRAERPPASSPGSPPQESQFRKVTARNACQWRRHSIIRGNLMFEATENGYRLAIGRVNHSSWRCGRS